MDAGIESVIGKQRGSNVHRPGLRQVNSVDFATRTAFAILKRSRNACFWPIKCGKRAAIESRPLIAVGWSALLVLVVLTELNEMRLANGEFAGAILGQTEGQHRVSAVAVWHELDRVGLPLLREIKRY